MNEFYSLINKQNATFLDLESTSLNISAITPTSTILHLITIVSLMRTRLKCVRNVISILE